MSDLMKDNQFYILIGLIMVILVVQLVLFFQLSSSVSYIKGLLAGGRLNVSHQAGGANATLTISATGSAKGIPSRAIIYVDVKGLGKTGDAATANLTAELNQTNVVLNRFINGNTSLIQTSYYNLYNQSSYYYTTYNGYVAEESLTVTILNFSNASKVVAELSPIKGISISSESASFSDSELASLRLTALSNALANATAQAHALLPNKNVSVENITVNYYTPIVVPLGVGTAAVSAGNSTAPSPPQFYSGTQTVTESITVVFSYRK